MYLFFLRTTRTCIRFLRTTRTCIRAHSPDYT